MGLMRRGLWFGTPREPPGAPSAAWRWRRGDTHVGTSDTAAAVVGSTGACLMPATSLICIALTSPNPLPLGELPRASSSTCEFCFPPSPSDCNKHFLLLETTASAASVAAIPLFLMGSRGTVINVLLSGAVLTAVTASLERDEEGAAGDLAAGSRDEDATPPSTPSMDSRSGDVNALLRAFTVVGMAFWSLELCVLVTDSWST